MGSEKDDPNATTEKTTNDATTEKGVLTRRRYLQVGAAATAIAAGGAAARTSEAASTVDIVEAGADPNGNQPIDSVLDRVAGSNTTVKFPEGTYLLGGFSSSANNLRLEGGNVTIKVQSGGTLLSLGGEGFVVDGFEFDQRGNDEPTSFSFGGPGGWEVRNCVLRGRVETSTRRRNILMPEVNDSSKTGTIRRFYLQDGSAAAGELGEVQGLWCGPNIKGTLHLDGLWMEHFANNTLYASNVPGKVVIENSFFRNTNSGVRVGGETEIRNCTFVKDGGIPKMRHRVEKGYGGAAMRGIWLNANKTYGGSGTTLVEDCDFVFTDSQYAGTPISDERGVEELVVRNCRTHMGYDATTLWVEGSRLIADNYNVSGTDNPASISNSNVIKRDIQVMNQQVTTKKPPIPKPPELGTTPNGGSTGGNGDAGGTATPTPTERELPNLIRIEGSSDPTEVTNYEFTVGGGLKHAHVEGASVDDSDTVEGKTATGKVADYVDAYRFSGEVTNFDLDGPATISLNGEQVKASSLGSAGTPTDTPTPTSTPTPSPTPTDSPDGGRKIFTVRGPTGADSKSNYVVEVSGDLKHADVQGASIDDTDTIDGSTARGFVVDYADAYYYTGSIERLVLDGRATFQFGPEN